MTDWSSFDQGVDVKGKGNMEFAEISSNSTSSTTTPPQTAPSTFGVERVSGLREVFDNLDHDGDGKVSREDVQAALGELGGCSGELGVLGVLFEYTSDRSLEEEQVCRAVSGDTVPWCLEVEDEEGCIDFDGFVRLLHLAEAKERARRLSDIDEEVAEAFQHFDCDGDGFITAEDLLRVLTELGQELDLEDAEAIVAEADEDGDGRLDVFNFRNALYQGRSEHNDCDSSMPLARPSATARVSVFLGTPSGRAAANVYRSQFTAPQLTGARRRRFRASLKRCFSTKQFRVGRRQGSNAHRLLATFSWRRLPVHAN